MMMKALVPTLCIATLTLAVPSMARADSKGRLDEAATMFEEIMQQPDKGIPTDLLQKASCLVLVPGVKKGAFIVGGKYGRGFVVCRKGSGWSAPGGVRVEGGSVGFQIGGSESDVFMLVMNDKGADKLLSSKFTLGGDASVAAGPIGRTTSANTDATMRAEILSWSRARGIFVGISLDGATLRDDEEANQELYGKPLTNREIVKGSTAVPPSAHRLMQVVAKY